SPFSVLYGIFVLIWSVVFTEYWKRREQELASLWGVKNVSKTETKRVEFKGERIVIDPVTGENVPYFPQWKRWTRRVVGVPIILSGAIVLAAVISCVFCIEVFLTVY